LSITDTLLPTRARLVELHDILSAQRSAWFRTGKFDLRTLDEASRLAQSLPNLRTESLKALAAIGDPPTLPASDASLTLAGIGWNAARLDELDDARRIQAVEQAIARLADVTDHVLLASATVIAKALPNDQDEWAARLAPLAEWATKHADEISEETPA
jgi:hypothetical protein